PVLLLDQNRALWDQVLVRRGLAALERAEALGGAQSPYALQAAIAACHARARTPAETDWTRIAALLRRAGPARAVARRGAESRGRRLHGVRSGGGPRAGRCADRGAGARGLPPLAERARRSPREARPLRRGARRVRARGSAHPKRTGAPAAARARRRVRAGVGGGIGEASPGALLREPAIVAPSS